MGSRPSKTAPNGLGPRGRRAQAGPPILSSRFQTAHSARGGYSDIVGVFYDMFCSFGWGRAGHAATSATTVPAALVMAASWVHRRSQHLQASAPGAIRPTATTTTTDTKATTWWRRGSPERSSSSSSSTSTSNRMDVSGTTTAACLRRGLKQVVLRLSLESVIQVSSPEHRWRLVHSRCLVRPSCFCCIRQHLEFRP